jgi:hypothetical protein
MKISTAASTKSRDYGIHRIGALDLQRILDGKEGSLNNFGLLLTHAITDWSAPAHRHNFEQVRYVMEGEVSYGDGTPVHAGAVVYFPESVPYGYQTRKAGTVMLEVQFGGASGNGFLSREQVDAATASLKKRGTFENGKFVHVDAAGKRREEEPYEVIWREVKGEQIKYAGPRYHGIVKMNPDHCQWVESKAFPGVAHKWLGSFTERETRIGFIRMDAGATMKTGLRPSEELLFLTKGKFLIGDQEYLPLTAMSYAANESAVIQATEPCEFFCLGLPNL